MSASRPSFRAPVVSLFGEGLFTGQIRMPPSYTQHLWLFSKRKWKKYLADAAGSTLIGRMLFLHKARDRCPKAKKWEWWSRWRTRLPIPTGNNNNRKRHCSGVIRSDYQGISTTWCSAQGFGWEQAFWPKRHVFSYYCCRCFPWRGRRPCQSILFWFLISCLYKITICLKQFYVHLPAFSPFFRCGTNILRSR